MRLNNWKNDLRRWCRSIHRDLSFLFSGVIIVYAISGFCLNHKSDFNSDFHITQTIIQLKGEFPQSEPLDKQYVLNILEQVDSDARYTKHYYPSPQMMKVFLKGGSSLIVNMHNGEAHYEHVQKRYFLSALNRLHYNPIRWWTWFSDLFAAALLIITITGFLMVKGAKGIWGRGGIEFLIGIVIPLIFLFFIIE